MTGAAETPSLSARFDSARRTLWLIRNYVYDYRRFARSSFLQGPTSREGRKADRKSVV